MAYDPTIVTKCRFVNTFLCVSDKPKGKGARPSQLVCRCTRGDHPFRSEITLPKVLFLILGAEQLEDRHTDSSRITNSRLLDLCRLFQERTNIRKNNETKGKEYVKRRQNCYTKTILITKKKCLIANKLPIFVMEREKKQREGRNRYDTFFFHCFMKLQIRKNLCWPCDLLRSVFEDVERRKRPVAKGKLTNGKDLSGATADVRAFFISEKRAACSLR